MSAPSPVATTDVVMPSWLSSAASSASWPSTFGRVKPSVNSTMWRSCAFERRRASADVRRLAERSVLPSGRRLRSPASTTACAGSFCRSITQRLSLVIASTPISSLLRSASIERAAAEREMSVLLTPPNTRFWPMPNWPTWAPPLQWQLPIEPDVSMASTSATLRCRLGSLISLTTGSRSSRGVSRYPPGP